MASSNQDAIQYVKDAHENLVRWLQNLSLIVEKLHQLDVLNSDDISKIEDESKCNKTRQMLDLILNKGEEACYNFLRILDHERKLVFPKPDVTSLTPNLHIWICLFSFRDEAEEYVQGPISCQELQEHLKTRGKTILDQQWQHNLQFYGEKAQNNFSFIPLVLDTDTEKNTPQNKIILKSKKFKKSRSKKMRAYIPKNTQGKTPEDLLYSKEKSILIVGKPGIGKTAFVQQMLHHWTDVQDSKHDFMFYFDENTMPNTSTKLSLENLLLDTFLMTHSWFKEKAEEILQYLQEYSERVLIVFDGIKDFHENKILLETMQHKTLSEAKIVATCRHEVEYNSYWPTCKVYIQGFSEESIYVLLKKMPANDRIIDSIINYPALFSLCHIPMYAFMVAAYISYYTSDEAEKICTASDLYVQIFRHCLQKHGKTNLRYLDGHIKNCRDMVLSLAERAFNATKFKTINLEFDYDERGIAGAFLTIVPVMSPTCAKTFCAFPHNTMQEFFSALWLLEKTEVVDEVLHLCQTEDSKHMKHVIPFLCGLQSQTNIDLLKSLFSSSKVIENINGFFEKVFNTFLCDQPDDENVDIGFICRCLYEFQSPETCCSFLERIEYHLDLSEEHLDPYSCYAVSYVISQSRNQQVHLNLTNSAVPLSGLKTILQHSSHLRDLSATLSQIWTIALKCEELKYLMHLLVLCENKIYIPMSSQTDVLEQAGKMITRNAEPTNLHLHCDKDPEQLTDLFFRTVFSWLPHINSLQFTPTQGETMEKFQRKCRLFKLDLYLQACQREKHIWQTFEKVIPEINEQSDFLLDLYSYMSETDFFSFYLAEEIELKLSYLDIWFIKLSNRKVAALLEVLECQIENKTVKLIDCSDDESVVRSFLTCLPYISQLRIDVFDSDQKETERTKICRTFLLDLCLQAALHQPQNIQRTVKKVMTNYKEYLHGYTKEGSDFLLDLYSHVKQYDCKTGRSVLLVLLPVYQSLLNVWSIKLSERNVSVLLEVLKLQTKKKPVKLIGWPYSKSVVRSFLQCLPYISQLYVFDSDQKETERTKRCRTFLLDLCLQAALHQPQNIQRTVKTVMTNYKEYLHGYTKEGSDFLLDLYSHVQQYESETGRSVLLVLLPVYQSLLNVWSIKLSERNVSVLLEVLKLQTKKKPVKLIGWPYSKSVVRSFLQCLPYISQLYVLDSGLTQQKKKCRTFLLDLCLQAALHQPQDIQNIVKKVTSNRRCHFLLDLYSHVKQYESETGRSVLPALRPVYQSLPDVWSIKLSERNVSILLEVLKLQTKKKPVKLIDCSDDETVVTCFLQCLPYISQLRFYPRCVFIQFLVNLSIAAVHCQSDKGESFTELLASVCSYNTFPFSQEFDELHEEQSDFLLDLYVYVKWYKSRTGRSFLPALLPVYQALPAVWSIKLSESEVFILLEVLKLQTEKKPLNLIDWPNRESKVRCFLQCLPHISQLRCEEKLIPRLSKAVVDCAEDTELVRAFFAATDFIFTVDWDLSTHNCSALGKVLNLSDSKLKLTLKSRDISLQGARLLFQNITHLQKLCLTDRVVVRMSQALRAVRAGDCLVIEELCLDLTSRNTKTFTFLNGLNLLLNIWTIHSLNLTECRIEAQSFISLLCHPGNFNIRISEATLQQFTDLLWEVQDGKLTRCFLEKVGGDLTSCFLSWEKLIYFLQQRVCRISVNITNSEMTYNQSRQFLPLLSEVQFKRLNLSDTLSIIREIYETRSDHCVSSLLSSTHNCINLNKTELNSYLCSALRFTLQHYICLSEPAVDFHTREGCSKTLLLQFLSLLYVGNESDCMRHAMSLSQALNRHLDLSNTPLDLHTCRSLALFLESSEGLSELDLSHCQLTNYFIELLFPHLHKAAVLDLSHNNIDDGLAERIYTVVSNSSNIQVVRLFNNRITNIKLFQEDKRFEIW